MEIKLILLKKIKEVVNYTNILDEKYKNVSSLEAIRDYARNNGKFEVLNELMEEIYEK